MLFVAISFSRPKNHIVTIFLQLYIKPFIYFLISLLVFKVFWTLHLKKDGHLFKTFISLQDFSIVKQVQKRESSSLHVQLYLAASILQLLNISVFPFGVSTYIKFRICVVTKPCFVWLQWWKCRGCFSWYSKENLPKHSGWKVSVVRQHQCL